MNQSNDSTMPPTDNKYRVNLTGQKLVIPDLWPAFSKWKSGTNPHQAGLVENVIKPAVERTLLDEQARNEFLGMSCEIWIYPDFPDASAEVLEPVALFTIWLLLFGDLFVYGSSSLFTPFLLDTETRTKSMEDFLRKYEAWKEEQPADEEERRVMEWEPENDNPEMVMVYTLLDDVRLRLWERHGVDEEELKWLDFFVALHVEERFLLDGIGVMGREFYDDNSKLKILVRRKTTCAVEIIMWFSRVLGGKEGEMMPSEKERDIEEIRELELRGKGLGTAFVLINELFTLKKKLENEAECLIPIIMEERNYDLEAATHSVVQQIYAAIKYVDEQTAAYKARCEPDVAVKIDRLVEAYQTIITSTLHFCTSSPWYGLMSHRQEDGSFVITL
ncbi:hypothetical protein QBC35DRAFT_529691 [Podospora australis]|uniref:Terpene synthase n=1 Tax=Podospora australis TaxID=1536484 RepID=A0AAN6X3N4_9PEZI|nr:hypothetical protein QBC35DRAFT_529691 [Podospora australis]